MHGIIDVSCDISMSDYESKSEEMENVFNNFKSDITYYISDFKIKYASATNNINYILNELSDYIWKEFTDIKETILSNLKVPTK